MITKDKKPQVSIDSIKQVVKKLKNQGFQNLTHFDLALSLVTIGFKQVCKQFGAKWTDQHQKLALKTLSNSQYDISWYGKSNNLRFAQILPLTIRGDIQKIKDIIRTISNQGRKQLLTTVDNFKRTPLHLAVKQNFDVLTEFLINEGFTLNSRDRQLKTPLHYCRSQLACQILLKKGANVYVKDNKLCTPAHYAATLQDSKVLQILLKNSNIVNQRDSLSRTPIFYAVFNNSTEQINILRVLIQNNAKINQKDLEGRTPLHYACQSGKSRCIPFLLQKGASIDIKDKHKKTPLDLACNDKIKKILIAYTQSRGMILQPQQKQKRQEYSKIQTQNSRDKEASTLKQKQNYPEKTNAQIFTKQLNQVSTWIREKFFVLMKKLQQSGVKSNWHIKRPYIYTGSWAQDIQSLEDLYQTFLNTSGPQAAMRAFNILCPYEKPLPKVLGKSEQAFQSFFGQNWFSNDPVQKVRNIHSQSKIKLQLQIKAKQLQDLKTQLLGYRSQMQKLQTQIAQHQSQIRRYQKIQDELRKQRAKNTHQYAQLLELMGEKQQLKTQIQNLIGGEEKTKILSDMMEDLKTKNSSLQKQIEIIKARQAASRRKCGQIFLKSLSQASAGQASFKVDENNLFDDDAIINLYDLLKQNPPNLEKRFKKADKKGKGKLTVQQFTILLQQLSMLPQDVMSMHRITGFAYGRKTLSMDQFRTILQNRHKNRPMWQKKLIKKIKDILTSSNLSVDKFFSLVDKDGSGTIQATQLRKGLQNYNIFMNHTDWCNLFNLLDSDNSGQIDLNELKTLLSQEKTGKLDNISCIDKVINDKQQQKQQQQKQQQNQQKQHQNQQKQEQQQNKDNNKDQQQQDKIKQQQPENDQQQGNQSQKQSYESRQQIGKDILEDSEQKFSQPYTEKDSDVEQGIEKINGVVKVQLPKIKMEFAKNKQEENQQQQNQGEQQEITQVYVKFAIDDIQYVKLAELSATKLSIAVQFDMIEYKIIDREQFNLEVSMWKARQFTQQNYLGQHRINLGNLLDEPQKWAINSKFQLEAVQFQKEDIPRSVIVVQVKWIPTKQQ